MRPTLALLAAAALAAGARAQTVSTTDAFGDTIIGFLTVDIDGDPFTSTLETIPPSTTSIASSTSTTSSTLSTTSSTTTDPLALPTSTPSTTPSTTATKTLPAGINTAAPYAGAQTTGTVLDYSAWLSIIGTATAVGYGVPAASANAASGALALAAPPPIWIAGAVAGLFGAAAVLA